VRDENSVRSARAHTKFIPRPRGASRELLRAGLGGLVSIRTVPRIRGMDGGGVAAAWARHHHPNGQRLADARAPTALRVAHGHRPQDAESMPRFMQDDRLKILAAGRRLPIRAKVPLRKGTIELGGDIRLIRAQVGARQAIGRLLRFGGLLHA
jgi:hypothetical protein